MGRKRIYEETTIVVDADGELIVWVNGSLSGNKELLKNIQLASDINKQVEITSEGPHVNADLEATDNLVQIFAALLCALPGRTRLLEAPDELLEILPTVYKKESHV